MFSANLLLLCVSTGILAADPSTTAGLSFTGKEIFPIDFQISHLRAEDMDGDGLKDLVVVNNSRSKINLLYNQTGKTNSVVDARKRELNELPPDARFKIDSIASEKRISSLLVADLNNDKRMDLAYYGEPKELAIHYQEGTNSWGNAKRIPIDDGVLDPYAVSKADLNGDRLADLLLLGESHIYYFAQTTNGTLAEPEKIAYSGTIKSVQALDIQGDGREDLLLVNWDNPYPFRMRLQSANHQLGPEVYFQHPPIRSFWPEDLDKDGKGELITIAQKSGRAQWYHFAEKEAEQISEKISAGQFQVMPLNKSSRPRRGSLWKDVTGDGLADLLVAEPESGQLALYPHDLDSASQLGNARTFSSFTGVAEIAAEDWNLDGKPEIFVLSLEERQIGVSSFETNGGLPFPKSLATGGRPLAIAAGGLTFQGKPALAALVEKNGGRELSLRTSDGESYHQKLSAEFKGNPSMMKVHDMDQDGLKDLIVLIPYEKLKLLIQTKDGLFEEVDLAAPGGTAEQPWVTESDIDGDKRNELLIAQKNFIRAVVLKSSGSETAKNWTFEVKEQVNGSASSSRLLAATVIPEKENEAPLLAMLDGDRKTVTISRKKEGGVFETVRSLSLPFVEFSELNFFDGAAPTLFLNGPNAIGILPLHGKTWTLVERDGYETPIKDGFLHDVLSGDLNNDSVNELVFLETGRSYVDVVMMEKDALVPGNRWQVFQERTFRNRRNELPEPREAVIADVTGDGRNDLLLLVHDRIVLYPQE
ncbi:MAG: VCBS repeat-containing protein [Verrucomicrobiota bacterium]|nr:VCBS repeat-containing protein [Verrucomicrobiota bacterium]